MKKGSAFIFILLFALILAGCQRASSGRLLLRLSDKKVMGEEAREETKRTDAEPDLYGSTGRLISDKGTHEPSGEEAQNATEEFETPDAHLLNTDAPTSGPENAEPSNEGQTDPEEGTEAPETAAPVTDPPSTAAPVTVPPTTPAPATTEAPTTTPAPTTTEAPPTTPAPTTTEAPTTTPAPTTTEAPTTEAPMTTEAPPETEDTAHTAANVARIEIRTLPDKTFYDQYAEPISTKGMTLLAVWEDGFEKILTDGFTIIDGKGNVNPSTEAEGEQTIYVYYGEKGTSFKITYRLSETAPLRVVDSYDPGRVFYCGEYVKYLISYAWVGNQRVETSKLTFSQERLESEGTVTVEISYGKHTAQRTYNVVSGSQFMPAIEDLKWLLNIATSDSWLGMTLTASWFAEYALQEDARPPFGRPLITSIVPDEEFTFDPAVLDYEGVQLITVTCRGVTFSCYSDLY